MAAEIRAKITQAYEQLLSSPNPIVDPSLRGRTDEYLLQFGGESFRSVISEIRREVDLKFYNQATQLFTQINEEFLRIQKARSDALADVLKMSNLSGIPPPDSVSGYDVPAVSVQVSEVAAVAVEVNDVPAVAVEVNDVPAVAGEVNDLPAVAVEVNDLPAVAVEVNDLPAVAVEVNDLPAVGGFRVPDLNLSPDEGVDEVVPGAEGPVVVPEVVGPVVVPEVVGPVVVPVVVAPVVVPVVVAPIPDPIPGGAPLHTQLRDFFGDVLDWEELLGYVASWPADQHLRYTRSLQRNGPSKWKAASAMVGEGVTRDQVRRHHLSVAAHIFNAIILALPRL